MLSLNDNWIKMVKTPCYVIDENKLLKNLEILQTVKQRAGCKILLAQKAYSAFATYPLIAQYLDGCTASGIFEAKLGYEEFGKENHVFSPAYSEEDMRELVKICNHIVFNSPKQWAKFRDIVRESGRDIEVAIRVNPEYSEIETDIYNPCFAGSRLGTTLARFMENLSLVEGDYAIDGLHFHTMCEQNSDVLARTLPVFEEKFGFMLDKIKWVNFGGGHHITRDDYDIDLLCDTICKFKSKYNIEVYLEPGEAVALNAGYLVSSMMDVVKTPENGFDLAILDASAACHMPDVLEMPYRPEIEGAGKAQEKQYTYRFGGNTCLAGDIIGDYSFDSELSEGDRLVFKDMAIYSMCKNNTFNGIPLPAIYRLSDGEATLQKAFTYEDFKTRLS